MWENEKLFEAQAINSCLSLFFFMNFFSYRYTIHLDSSAKQIPPNDISQKIQMHFLKKKYIMKYKWCKFH